MTVIEVPLPGPVTGVGIVREGNRGIREYLRGRDGCEGRHRCRIHHHGQRCLADASEERFGSQGDIVRDRCGFVNIIGVAYHIGACLLESVAEVPVIPEGAGQEREHDTLTRTNGVITDYEVRENLRVNGDILLH